MDILDLYSRLKNSYKEYISSFVRIKDKRIEDVVTKATYSGAYPFTFRQLIRV